MITDPTVYTTILADPAWRYGDRLRQSKVKRSSVDQYRTTMTVEEIAALYTPGRIEQRTVLSGPTLGTMTGQPWQTVTIPPRLCGYTVADVGFLWLWTPASFLLDGSATYVCSRWGFTPRQIVPWVKARVGRVTPRDGCHNLPDYDLIFNLGMGHLTRVVTEYLIVATRGEGYTKLRKSKGEPGLILDPGDDVIVAPMRGHSRKPAEQYSKIERVCPGPYLELFGRRYRDGWTTYGDEIEPLPEPPIDWR